MRTFLKILTLACYFLPVTFFVATCGHGGLNYAYNKSEAAVQQLEETQPQVVPDSPTLNTDDPVALAGALMDTTLAPDTVAEPEPFADRILRRMVFPTETSLSAAGAVLYYKNTAGQLAAALGLLATLISLFVRRSSRFSKVLLLNLACLIFLIADSLLSSVTLLWGIWLLPALVLLQLWLSYREKRDTVKAGQEPF